MTFRSISSCLLLAGALAALPACAAAPINKPIKVGDSNTGAGTVNAARAYLEGRWSLESFEVYPPGKPPVALKGSGTLTYDDFGNLRMEIRADQTASDVMRAAGIQIGSDGVISSNGRTAVDMQNKTLTYVIEGQPAGNGPLALNRPRHWVVDGDILTVTTKDDAGKPLSIGRWKKTS